MEGSVNYVASHNLACMKLVMNVLHFEQFIMNLPFVAVDH